MTGRAWNSTLPQRSKPMRRGTGLAQGGTLSRGARLRPVSAKRAAENRERRNLVQQLFGGARARCMWPGCLVPADDVHEILPRARGGTITDPSIWATLCRPHHRLATSEHPLAYQAGLLFHSWQDPRGAA